MDPRRAVRNATATACAVRSAVAQAGDRPATERHLRMALDLTMAPTATDRDRARVRTLRTDPARVLLARGATEEARAVALPLCTGPGEGAPESLVQRGLCAR